MVFADSPPVGVPEVVDVEREGRAEHQQPGGEAVERGTVDVKVALQLKLPDYSCVPTKHERNFARSKNFGKN